MSGREKVHSKTDEVFVAEWIRKCEGKGRFTPKKEIKKYRVRGSFYDKINISGRSQDEIRENLFGRKGKN